MKHQATDEDGGNAHDHVVVYLDFCSQSDRVSVQCTWCDGEVDGFDLMDGTWVVERRRILDAYAAHEEFCPSMAVIEEEEDDEDDG